ncbi:MAG: type I methionyl aminopeptidase [Deltaproteobacteria bacterium]|nr:type I methionyl aminopeptidase [Deltaproteobacteria bacterium]
MVLLKSAKEIEIMRKANLIVAEVLNTLKETVKPGVSTGDLDKVAEEYVKKKGVKAAFKGYNGYPASICASVNEEVVHGIPSPKRILEEGDIVGIDFGVCLDGYFGDAAITIAVGNISTEAEALMKVTEESLYKAIEMAKVGNRLSDISYAVQSHVEAQGYSVVREFVGHGIGKSLHEQPQVPNFGQPKRGIRLKAGMVLAIEPMINQGKCGVRVKSDGWTAVTDDGLLSSHYEHSVAITKNGPYILSKI